jgi:hypothetical protein
LFALLGSRLVSPVSLEFIPSGTEKGGGANAVKDLVTALRRAGNPWVLGVVDRDDREAAPEGVMFVGGRHSLENLVLDPLSIGVFLLREGMVASADMGLPQDARHFELTAADAQTVADFVVRQVTQPGDDNTAVTVGYVGDFSLSIPRFYLDIPGHELEDRLKNTFLPLRAYAANLKTAVVERAARDVPHFVPDDVMTLFRALVEA